MSSVSWWPPVGESGPVVLSAHQTTLICLRLSLNSSWTSLSVISSSINTPIFLITAVVDPGYSSWLLATGYWLLPALAFYHTPETNYSYTYINIKHIIIIENMNYLDIIKDLIIIWNFYLSSPLDSCSDIRPCQRPSQWLSMLASKPIKADRSNNPPRSRPERRV